MKKKLSKLLVIIALLSSLCITTIRVSAESGWDASYDSGSSWDSGSSYSDNWGDSSSDSYYSIGYESSSGVGLIIIIIIGITFIIIFYKALNQGKINKDEVTDKEQEQSLQVEQEVKEVLPNFNIDEFKTIVFENYKVIQEAWMNFDYDALKEKCSNELYNTYRSELEVLKAIKQQNIMSDFNQYKFILVDKEVNAREIAVKVQTIVTCHDYVVDETGEVVRGKKEVLNTYLYEMTFIKSVKNKKVKCPNCGAKLDGIITTTCPYCRSKIVNKFNHDWVLSKKQMLKQWSD